jgi:hypothetical protein
MAIKYINIYPMKGPPKFSQIGIFLFEIKLSGNPGAKGTTLFFPTFQVAERHVSEFNGT